MAIGRKNVTCVRVQKGHSLLLWILLSFTGIGLIFLIYYTLSPNHYWHL